MPEVRHIRIHLEFKKLHIPNDLKIQCLKEGTGKKKFKMKHRK